MSIQELREAAILGSFVRRVETQPNFFCGETLLQKSAYFLKELFAVPLELSYRIYYYGPFSFDLRDKLASMEADDIVRIEPHQWGATYKTGHRYRLLEKQFPDTIAKYSGAVDWAVRELAPLTVKQLEPLATALFLSRLSDEASVESRATKLNEIKPHVSVNDARIAVENVDRWMESVAP